MTEKVQMSSQPTERPKVKLATVWLGGCSGCHMSFLDLDELLIELSKWVELRASPITDIKDFEDVDVALVEGAVTNSHNEHVLRELRKHARILVAIGDCSCFGGVSAMRNYVSREEALRRAYIESESTVNGRIPDDPTIPVLTEKVQPIQEFVEVDFYLPGCPPPPEVIAYAISELVQGRTPKLNYEMIHFD
ncbi:MAG: hydrogenase [Candidatus Poribacteria bacterium]|nr:MAG: hydrogenase [Candidatus Poribacteria bacterium]